VCVCVVMCVQERECVDLVRERVCVWICCVRGKECAFNSGVCERVCEYQSYA